MHYYGPVSRTRRTLSNWLTSQLGGPPSWQRIVSLTIILAAWMTFNRCSDLLSWLDEYYSLRDNKHGLYLRLRIPFDTLNLVTARDQPEHYHTFNCIYLNWMQIIGMGFELLTTKWRIFWEKLAYMKKNNAKIICVVMRLRFLYPCEAEG